MTSFVAAGPILVAPEIEPLVIAGLKDAMAPVPIMTRLANPADLADTVATALRVEAAGGSKANRFQWDLQFLLYGYSPDEGEANRIANRAVAIASAARGATINGWFIVTVPMATAAERRTDPNVILPRYMARCVWRITGKPLPPL